MKLYWGTQYTASFTNSSFVRTVPAVYNFNCLLLCTAEADRTIIARAQIFPTTSQNMDSDLRLIEKGTEKKNNIFISSACAMLLTTRIGLCRTSKHPLTRLLSLYHTSIPSNNCYLWPALFLRRETQIKILPNMGNTLWHLWVMILWTIYSGMLKINLNMTQNMLLYKYLWKYDLTVKHSQNMIYRTDTNSVTLFRKARNVSKLT